MPATQTCVIFVTCPDAAVAEGIARHLVDHRLAACGNVTGPVTSVYRWKGKVVRESEVLLLVKTRLGLVASCTKAIRSKHPYEVPEIVALMIAGGSAEYLQWVVRETGEEGPAAKGSPTGMEAPGTRRVRGAAGRGTRVRRVGRP